jgi:hypothetical protein
MFFNQTPINGAGCGRGRYYHQEANMEMNVPIEGEIIPKLRDEAKGFQKERGGDKH